MNTLTDTPRAARHESGEIIVTMVSGEILRFPLTISPRLAKATFAQLEDITLSPFGIHWPQIDEDLSIRGIVAYLQPSNH